MLRLFRAGVIVVALSCMSGGVAAADPVPLPFVATSKNNPQDGWVVGISLSDMTVNAVPNMAATAFTREGFVTATATLTIEGGTDKSTDVTSSALQLWYQVSCQIDVSNGLVLQGNEGGTGVALGGSIDNAGAASTSVTPGVAVDPGFNAPLKPGTISEKSLGEIRLPPREKPDVHVELTGPDVNEMRQLKDGRKFVRVIHVKDSSVRIDNCGGPVFVRLHARASMSTFRSDNDVDVYSAIVPL